MSDTDRERVIVDAWDWQTRVLHWVIAILVISLGLIMLGKEGLEIIGVPRNLRAPLNTVHAYVGYAFVCFFILRLIWAFVGNRYARWADIIPAGAEQRQAITHNIRWYLSGFKGKAARVVGHDPLASLFYIALFVVLVSQAVSGLLLSGVELHMFPGSLFTGGLGEHAAEELEDVLEELHEFGFWFIIFFLSAHLFGLVVHEIKEKTGLLSSMVHGKKYMSRDE